MIRTLAIRPVARMALVAALALALTGVALALAPSAHEHDTVSASSRTSRATFHDAMRGLWEDHIVWTRMAIGSIGADPPDPSCAVALLREHIVGAADLLVAAKTGVGFEAAHEAWYANGAEIGAFLADANPRNWDRAEMHAMMADHLDLTLAEAVARLQGEYAADVAAYDQIHVQILHMADMLSDGIVAQFPGAFSR